VQCTKSAATRMCWVLSVVLSVERWVLGLMSYVVCLGSWVLGLMCYVLCVGSWVLGLERCVLGLGSWVLGLGCYVLGVGCWVLGVGCLVPLVCFAACFSSGSSGSSRSFRNERAFSKSQCTRHYLYHHYVQIHRMGHLRLTPLTPTPSAAHF